MSLQLPNRPSVSHSSREEHEEDPSEWGFDESGEDGVDFKKKIADLTHRAHGSHFFPTGSGADSHDAVLNALDGLGFDELDIEEEGDGSIADGESRSAPGGSGENSLEWKMLGADEWQMRNREFSTVVWQTNDEGNGNGWTQSPTPRNEDSSNKSSLATHSSSNSLASSATTSDTSSFSNNQHPPTSSSSSSRSGSISNGSSLSEHVATRTHPPTPTASNNNTAASSTTAPHHHSANSISTAGSGRNLSLDSSARALGINILYVERLALPLLRSEIHSFFSKLLVRLHALLHLMETDPVLLLQRSQEGMRGNMLQATDEELRRNFLQSIEQLQHQIDEIRAAQNANGSAATTTTNKSIPHSASPPSTDSHPQPSSSTLSTQQLLLSISPSALLAPSPVVSPAHGSQSQNPSQTPQSKSTSRSSAGNGSSSSSSTSVSFPPHPQWWPPSLVSSYASLQRMRELFLMIKLGFDDATSNTGSTTTPTSTATQASTVKSRVSGGGASLFSAKLQALPTTHSNRDGLSTLARIMQSFSRLVALEGGSIQAASRLALCFQRLANTMLEKHGVEEPKWSQSKHA